MKVKISVSMEEETLRNLAEAIEGNKYRNKSHFIESAVEKLLGEVKNGK